MSFDGFSRAALDFYAGLEGDNSKGFWLDHKPVYESAVRGPLAALADSLVEECGPYKIFRPHRDVRFGADKSPYKTHAGAYFESGGYIQLAADGLACGAGYYSMDRGQLARFRDAVVAEPSGTELDRIIAAVPADIEVRRLDPLTTAPRGYPADHPRITLLRAKGLVLWRDWPVEPWLFTAEVRDRVAEFLHAAVPLCTWLDARVGPASPVAGRSR
ncbi:DUF2461 domain-containing protein [Klugiella xanthotipulae]|uniref:Uncharacterized protein (TIGR02453 family) n=1 Tax=Klugiella xanthotipulae TaxID=244735 RepID=A0A543HH29_9MICO|nr:DUF2461 domain-containing protein [Klugiella xanthotipulae]TQM57644.1 uncharacterized protein (TIGR02453 family) [Klugiella xanthotipulae]